MNSPVQGQVQVEMGGDTYTLVYRWEAIDKMSQALPDEFDLSDLNTLGLVASIGFAQHHPDLTPECLWEMSPPINVLISAVQQAQRYAYLGLEKPPKAEKKKRDPVVVGWRRRFASAFGWGSDRVTSGG